MKIASAELLVEMMPELETIIRGRLAHRVLSLGARFDLDDVCQTVWQSVFRFLDTCQAETVEQFKHWVLTIAKNTTESMVTYERGSNVRSTRREECAIGVSIDGEGDGYQPAARTVDPAVQAEVSEECQAMLAVIESLPKSFRTVLTLKYIDGLENDEVAAQMGCHVDTVRSLHSKALKMAREQMVAAV